MLVRLMYVLILFTCTGLLAYWASRTALLTYGDEDQIERTLENDLWGGRHILLGIKAILFPPSDWAA